MKTILFDNDIKSNQDIQEVKDQLFEAAKDGNPFIFVTCDGDGDNWASHYECLETEHDYIEQILDVKKNKS